MTVLVVTGTRRGRPDVEDRLDAWVAQHGYPSRIVIGDAAGVDFQARRWAIERGVTWSVHVADWKGRGRLAGPERNQRMVDAAGPGAHLLALPDWQSVGTYDCIARARKAKLHVQVCPVREDAEARS